MTVCASFECKNPIFRAATAGVRTLIITSALCGAGWGQTALSLSSGSGSPGQTVTLNLSSSATGTAPAALQWTVGYSTSDFSSATMAIGSAGSGANKSIACNSGAGSIVCVLSGSDSTTISNGTVATVTLTIASSTTDTSSQVNVSGSVACDGGGSELTSSASGATVAIAQAAQTWSISGTVSPALSGVSMALTGAATQNATTNTSGAYSFSGLANGSYTVTPALSGYTFTPSSQSVTVNGANQSSVNFTDAQVVTYVAPTVDVQTSKNERLPSSTITSSRFSTASGNELLLALVSTDTANATVKSVSGAGLTWVLVERTSAQSGTAEIWGAFSSQALSGVEATVTLTTASASSLTVASFAGVDTSGTNGSGAIGAVATANAASGAPSASLVTTRNNSLVWGVGDDPSGTTAPVALSGEGVVHEYSSMSKGTFWVQRVTNPVAQSGTAIAFGDSSPSNEPYNLSVVEILGAASGNGGTDATRVHSMISSNTGTPVTMYNPATGATGDVCSPGGLASISGAGFTSEAPQTAKSSPAPAQLAGVQVKVNGQAAPLLYASASRVNFLCPQLPAGSPLDVAVQGENGVVHKAAPSSMSAAVPRIFTVGAGNQGLVQIAATNEISMPHTESIPSRPAQPGDALTIYATGLGTAGNAPAAGSQAPAAPQTLNYPVQVVIGAMRLNPTWVRINTEKAGVYEVGVTLPSSRSTGNAVPVHLEMTLPDQTTLSSNTVTMAIQ